MFRSLLKLFRKEGPLPIYDVLREYLKIVSERCFVNDLFNWYARKPSSFQKLQRSNYKEVTRTLDIESFC